MDNKRNGKKGNSKSDRLAGEFARELGKDVSKVINHREIFGPGDIRKKDYIKTADSRIKFTMAVIIIIFAALIGRVGYIMANKGDEYSRQVLAQQEYASTSIPAKRGSIVASNGKILAQSEKVYKLILDSYHTLEGETNDHNMDVTLDAVEHIFGVARSDMDSFISANPGSKYKVILPEVTYAQMMNYKQYIEDQNNSVRSAAAEAHVKPKASMLINSSAVYFEPYYRRVYPEGTLASDVLGYISDSKGAAGLEGYYNDILTGTDGREYGYLMDENSFERTTIEAENGKTIVTTIDPYIQSVCETSIAAYNEEHAGEFREGEMGSVNTGVIVMKINTGEILAMASYPYYNPNEPNDLSMYTPETVSSMVPYVAEAMSGASGRTVSENEVTELDVSAFLWQNFCTGVSYEPGSVCKTFTVAAGLDTGAVHDGDTFNCGGDLTFGEGKNATTIHCHNRNGDGILDVKQAVEKSCNVSLMLMGQRLGKDEFLRYQRNFGFGSKTGVDLSGEMDTSGVVFNENTMGLVELMTSTFGQGFRVTMIQTITAYCSLINGGYLYKPHLVSRIENDDGTVVQNIEPEMIKQVISPEVSDLMKDYCIGVVDEGTGTRARPAGYRIGGKTGTAEYSGKGKVSYTVSFMGFAPADDPQIAIYVVIDRPNAASQEDGTRYACLICREILGQILPHLGVPKTELITEEERKDQNIPNTAVLHGSSSQEGGEEEETEGGDDIPVPEDEVKPEEETGEGDV